MIRAVGDTGRSVYVYFMNVLSRVITHCMSLGALQVVL